MIQSLTPEQAQDLISKGVVDVVDVRDPGEWSEGHIPGARLIPLEQLRASPEALLTGNGVMFVCAAGIRSQTAARIAAARGVSTVYSLSGGTRAWVRAGLHLVNDLSRAV